MSKKIDKGLISANLIWDDAISTASAWGITDLYSTGNKVIDTYIGHGFGRPDGYEIVTIFGDTGMNKSTFATNLIVDPLLKGKHVVYMALEDDPQDVCRRLNRMGVNPNDVPGTLSFMKEQDGYTLEAMAEVIEEFFSYADVILIDPLQFVYEASVMERGETEMNRQRLFMRQMNNIMKRTNKVLIIVSHTNKGNSNVTGLNKIIGSSAIAQVSTKCIEIGYDKDNGRFLKLWKTRFTPRRNEALVIRLKEDMTFCSLLEVGDDQKQIERDIKELYSRWGEVPGMKKI